MKFGIFDTFWDNQPNHLPFLNLSIDLSYTDTFNLGKSLKRIDDILSNNTPEDIYNDTILLLNNINWRLHLIACITVLKLKEPDQQKYIGFLWKRLCLGSWVSPQLLVTLSKIDFNFKEKCDVILNDDGLEKFRTNYLINDELTEIKFNPEISNNKILNALRYLKNGKHLDNIDDDNGAKIALNWNKQLIEMITLGLLKTG